MKILVGAEIPPLRGYWILVAGCWLERIGNPAFAHRRQLKSRIIELPRDLSRGVRIV